MSNKEEKTYIGSAEIRYENTDRRDRLVKAAEKAGFKVRCTEAIGISFSGATTPTYWYIVVEMPGTLGKEEQVKAKDKLRSAWRGL